MNSEDNSPEHNSPEHHNSEQTESPSNLSLKLRNALALISALCDDQITPGQFAELESLVCTDDEVGQFYVQMMHLNASLHHFSAYFAPGLPGDPGTNAVGDDAGHSDDVGHSLVMDESMVLPAMKDQQNDEGDESRERFQPASVLSSKPVDGPGRLPFTKAKGGIAALVLLGVGILSYVMLRSHDGSSHQTPSVAVKPTPTPTPTLLTPIATLNFTVKPVWERPATPPLDGNFFAADSLAIESGDVQLSFHHGGYIVVEGPAELEFISDTEISLHSGKIVATIPGGGLVIRCPNGSVTDLGTEFGVAVHPDGATEVAVFKGSVSASLKSAAATQPGGDMVLRKLVLTIGQAAVMTQTALTVDEKGAIPQHYVRSLVNDSIKSLDVTDLISGGDGTTRRRGIGIDPSTGAVGNLPPVFARNSDGKYHRANGYPFIDGAFIADATRETMIVDSAGDRFHFPGIGSTAYNYIFTGGKIPWPEKPEPDTVLNGVDYSTPDHSIICIHPNNAFTLDLNAVRRIYPDLVVKRFHCKVGISGNTKPKPPKIPDGAVLVLMDGAQRFQNAHFTIFDGSFDVDVPINQTDRFMTLVSTYAGPGNYRNWVLWVDAKLDLSAGN